MIDITQVETTREDPEVLQSLLQVGINLTTIEELPKMLDLILQEVRKLARAEAGSLYIVEHTGILRLVIAQNDRVTSAQIAETIVNREVAVTHDSLVGFVASTGETQNIPNTFTLPAGTPFRIDREADAITGYRAKSIFAIPLRCPDGKCIGVLELFNHLDEDGQIGPFPDDKSNPTLSLASMAAVTIHNALLQEELKRANLETILRLSVAAEYRDDETAGHVRRISHTSGLLAKQMGLTLRQVEVIRFSSPMHDVGKIGIPDTILHKPGRLNAEERRIIEKHPVIGIEILGDPLNDLVDAARAVALTHHERWDGHGYPNKLVGEDIPVVGRIVGLADVFDALVSKRCYKEAYPLEKALDIVREENGKHFDPRVVEAFFNVLEQVLTFYQDPVNSDGDLTPTCYNR